MVSQDWQATYNSLDLGPGTAYRIRPPIEGLADHPDVVTADQGRLRADGLTPGDDFLAGRTVTLQVLITGTTAPSFTDNVASFKQAFRAGRGITESALTFQVPGVAGGSTRRIVGRPRKLSAPVDVPWKRRAATVLVQFDCSDPRIYDDVESTVTADLAAAGTGHAWPQVWPMDWGGVSTSGIVTATNAGTYETPWTATITGPITNPSVENVDTGGVLKLSANGGITLSSTDTIVISSANRTVLLNGTASRYDRLSSPSWFDLPPGNTRIRFGGSTTGSPSLSLAFRSAWI